MKKWTVRQSHASPLTRARSSPSHCPAAFNAIDRSLPSLWLPWAGEPGKAAPSSLLCGLVLSVEVDWGSVLVSFSPRAFCWAEMETSRAVSARFLPWTAPLPQWPFYTSVSTPPPVQNSWASPQCSHVGPDIWWALGIFFSVKWKWVHECVLDSYSKAKLATPSPLGG